MSRFSDRHKEIDWGAHKDWRPARPERKQGASAPFFMPDIAPFISPIDYTEIRSRSALREHERKHGVRQVGDLKPQDFDNSTRKADTFNERRFEEAFRKAVERTGI